MSNTPVTLAGVTSVPISIDPAVLKALDDLPAEDAAAIARSVDGSAAALLDARRSLGKVLIPMNDMFNAIASTVSAYTVRTGGVAAGAALDRLADLESKYGARPWWPAAFAKAQREQIHQMAATLQ